MPSQVQLDRLAYRRSRGRRSLAIAIFSTVLVLVAIGIAVVNTKGWPQFRDTFFKLDYGWQVLPDIAKGLWLNIRLMVVCEIVILVLALALALARSLRGPVFFPLRALATLYTDVFRGLPA